MQMAKGLTVAETAWERQRIQQNIKMTCQRLKIRLTAKSWKEAVTSPEESKDEPANGLNVQEIANHLDSKVGGRSFDDQFRELYNSRVARNFFTWRLIHITLGFFNALHQGGNISQQASTSTGL